MHPGAFRGRSALIVHQSGATPAAGRLFAVAAGSPRRELSSDRCLITNEFLSFSTGCSNKCHDITAAASEIGKPAKNNVHHRSPVQVCGK